MNDAIENPADDDALLTPVFLASEAGPRAAADESAPGVHYVLASNGLFLVRRHAFFRSSVPAPRFPAELAAFAEWFEPRFPRIRQVLFERIVGFFSAAARAHGAEAGVLLYWDRAARVVRAIAPRQVATVSGGGRGRGCPVGLHYDFPARLPPHWVPFGDVHSHASLPAYSSAVDRHDETQSPGLHLVVGKLHEEPPAFHAEAVVDERRFPLALEDVVEGYERRRPFPRRWARRLRVVDVEVFERERAAAAAEAPR